jgi:hypothetical protein
MTKFGTLFGVLTLVPGCFLFQDQAPSTPADELLPNVNEIRDFELSLKELFGSYSACGTRDSALAEAKLGRREWATSPCWVNIGWEPDDKISGGYWVEVNGDDLLVGGLILHQDGSIIEVRASATDRATVNHSSDK